MGENGFWQKTSSQFFPDMLQKLNGAVLRLVLVAGTLIVVVQMFFFNRLDYFV